MLDKNPDMASIFTNSVNSILCHSAFSKQVMIQKILGGCKDPIIYLDFDLLYSGYVQSGMIQERQDIAIFRPKREDWESILKKIIMRISGNENYTLIVDSLNGFFTLFDENDSGRYANSCMMLLASIIKNNTSKMFLNSVARLRENDGWVLSIGRYVLENKAVSKFFVNDTGQIEVLSAENKIEKIITV